MHVSRDFSKHVDSEQNPGCVRQGTGHIREVVLVALWA